jgi:hypothetical protein
MTHISSIGAGMFSDMSVATPLTELSASALAALDTDAEFAALFASEIANADGTRAAGAFVRIQNVREFPGMGTPPNIVNVPNYGKKTSAQIQGQADAPSMELTLNHVGADWAKGAEETLLGAMVGDGIQRVFRFALLNAEPTGTGATKWATTAAGLGTVQNSLYYFIGKLEAIVVNPNLADANQSTLTLSMQSDMEGAFTVDPV